jgi:DNA polymerase-3 subunit delta
MPSVPAVDYLADPAAHPPAAVCVLFGDEALLARHALEALRRLVLGEGDGEFSLTRFEGDETPLRDVLDELATVGLFGGGRRLVVVDQADGFVSQHRGELEDYVARPQAANVLALSVASWPSNTRLAKAVASSGLAIECKAPAEAQLPRWLAAWAGSRHGLTLPLESAEAMVEAIGPELGLLDQELAKLAGVVGDTGRVTLELVEEYVAGWRVKTAWSMLDAALDGQTGEALAQLDRLVQSGENPIGILAQIAATLRRLAAATRVIEQAEAEGRRLTLRAALERAEVKPFALGRAEGQLRRLGRKRAGGLYAALLEADLALKGASSAPARARIVLERLVACLAAPQDRLAVAEP